MPQAKQAPRMNIAPYTSINSDSALLLMPCIGPVLAPCLVQHLSATKPLIKHG